MNSIKNDCFLPTETIARNLAIAFSFGGTRLYNGVPIMKTTTKEREKKICLIFSCSLPIAININIDGTANARE